MKRCLLLLLLLMLSACTTHAGYEKVLNTWIGVDELTLVRAWGPPVRVYETGGVRFLTYYKAKSTYIAGTAPSYQSQVIGNTIYTRPIGGSDGAVINTSCTTNFELKDGRVTSWHWDGYSCRAL